jgi:hypothetical protein
MRAVESPLGFAQAAIAAGAVAPDPGRAGAVLWSTTLAALVLWNGASWNALAAGGGSAAYAIPLDVTGGSVNAIVAAPAGGLPVLGGGAKMLFWLPCPGPSTGGSVSLEITGVLAAGDQRQIKYPDGTDISLGSMALGDQMLLDYREDIGNFRLLAPAKPIKTQSITLNLPSYGPGVTEATQTVANNWAVSGGSVNAWLAPTSMLDENELEDLSGCTVSVAAVNGGSFDLQFSSIDPQTGPIKINYQVL